ncbi:hypothetical protein [Nostoc sp. NMS7]|uniref:hypothetical protein n=1 Tax=Nostoc sp. NMS7 TaxID=2815391 RepID=UPI00260114C5|nr:hypothetical protein [Nostoc sp. NMS7]
MVWVEPWTVPAMLTGDMTIDAVRVKAINTELFTSGIEMNFPSSQAIINFPSVTLSGDGN